MQNRPQAARPIARDMVPLPMASRPDAGLSHGTRVLAGQMANGHRVTMSGLERVGVWADGLATRTDLSAMAVDRRIERIGRLGNTMARLMSSVQRAVVLMERIDATAARRPAPDA